MADLKIAEAKTLKWEGGYCNVEGDAGGETIFGMARKMHPDLKLWGYVDNYKKALAPFGKDRYKDLESLCKGNTQFKQEMNKFYRSQFWDKIMGDKIENQDVANALYDFAVNSGVSRAVKTIQKIVGVESDGAFGAKTLQAVNEYGDGLCNALCDAREEFFREIAKKGQNAKFLNGWLNRVKDFYV